jgi:hypothetical protein
MNVFLCRNKISAKRLLRSRAGEFSKKNRCRTKTLARRVESALCHPSYLGNRRKQPSDVEGDDQPI